MAAGTDLIEDALRFGRTYGMNLRRAGGRVGRGLERTGRFVGSHPYAIGLPVAAAGLTIGMAKSSGAGSMMRNSYWGRSVGPIAQATAGYRMAGAQFGAGRMSQTMNGMR